MVVNKGEDGKCVACSSPNPGAKQSAAPVKAEGFKFAKSGLCSYQAFVSVFSSWSGVCDTRLVRNKADSLSCVACSTPSSPSGAGADSKPTSTRHVRGGLNLEIQGV